MAKLSKQKVIKALQETKGAVYLAAARLNVSHTAIYGYINKYADVREVKEFYTEELNDIAELKLRQAVQKGEPWSIKYQLSTQGKGRGYVERTEITKDGEQNQNAEPVMTALRADQIARSYTDVYRDIIAHAHTEYVFDDGRGSGKSTFVAMMDVLLLENNPTWHVLVIRQYATTLRNSVFSQIEWAVNEIGHSHLYKFTTSPLEITYIPTGQKIFFRGADDPTSIKSIKPSFGAIAVLHFEEYDQLNGPEAVRSITQSAIRGTDTAYIFKVFNTPRSKNNWANKEMALPKSGRYIHKSSYLEMPPEWLGQVFIAEAEYLKEVNYPAYENEYLGIANSSGGSVFPNVEQRTITDAEIEKFDHVYEGIDWGYAVDPFHWGRMYYHAGKRELYIYDELRTGNSKYPLHMSNKELADALIQDKRCTPQNMIIADSAEPKSVADFNDNGLVVRGSEKGSGSVRYSIKWLQNLAKIVIDPVRCPDTAREFTAYEYLRTKDGELLSDYPDKDNHSIDMTRYAMNLIWRRRGQ